MVRRKEADTPRIPATPERKVKITRPTREVAEHTPAPARAARPARLRRPNGGVGRVILAVLAVVVLLGAGWFTTQWILGNGNGNVLAGLFGGDTELIGEEEGRVNFLMVGNAGDPNHDGPNLTDTIMLASYDINNKFVTLFSIPRDLYVKVPGDGSMKINAVYQTALSENKGMETIAKTVEELMGIPVPYYMRVDFNGFKNVIDNLGGVTVTVRKDLTDPLYPAETGTGYQTVEFKTGTYTMDGASALKYARSRETTSDFDRALRQQDVMLAVRNKALDLELLTAPTKVFEIWDGVSGHFETNLKKDEMERVLKLLSELDPAKVSNKVLDDSASSPLYGTRVEGAYVLMPDDNDYSKIAAYVAAALSQTTATPAEEETSEPLKIEVLNGTNITGLAGKVADKLKGMGYEIVRTGNNPTKGVKETVIYDNTQGAKGSALLRLNEILSAKASTDTITFPAGVEARVVVGENAQAFVQ